MAGFNPLHIMKLMNLKKEFEGRHPRFISFIQNELMTDVPEGTVMEITVTKPGKAPVTANMRITQEDIKLVEDLKALGAH